MATTTTVGQYLSAAETNRRLRRTTHHYVSDMIDYFGPERVFEGVYGMERQLADIVAYFKAYSMSMERRLLLLVGPQGSGKTMTVDRLKRRLEEYSHAEPGLIMTVDGCPFHQHPFDLVPAAELERRGFYWHEEAVPCPICDHLLARYGWEGVPVRRVFISARDKVGIAKHTPTDLRREDITNFVGNINFALLKERGSTYDPDAYDFEGKIIWANRGILDWTEVFKSRRQLLSLLLELIQSKRIDLANFPSVHVDEVVIGHSNYPEYNVFLAEDIMEPLRGRIHKIDFPYNVDLEGEKRIYATLIERANRVRSEEKHVPDDALALAARYALKTREESEGQRGLSPRFSEDAFSHAYTLAGTCLDLEVLATAIERTFQHQSIKDLNVKELLKQFEETKIEFINSKIDMIVEEVVPTHFYDYGQNLYLNYLDAATKHVGGETLTDADKELVDEVEGIMVQKRQISRQGRLAFENVLLERRDELRRMSYKDNDHLRPVINEIVFNKIKNLLRLYEKSEELDAKSQELLDVLYRTAIAEQGYCPVCARSLYKIIGRSF
ncbi:MAG: serine protein kinase PrkA, serine protein kinase [Armatimonadetes bacterium CSP1-3]|nr:MAG: serine protein kinase PrkA, serine protein kinase [Armatimonadetes bacterium CSP1-3]